MHSSRSQYLPSSASSLRIVRSEMTPAGEKVEVVRPVARGSLSSTEVVQKLMSQYDYKTNSQVRARQSDVNAIAAAFPTQAEQLLRTYEGSTIVADTQQDLIGDRYLSEQIRRVNEENRNRSVLDKWSHLLYEGDKDYGKNVHVLGSLPAVDQSFNAQTYLFRK